MAECSTSQILTMETPTISQIKNEPTRTVVVDDHSSLREMLVMILMLEGNYNVVGEAAGGIQGMNVCRATRPALVILDLVLPELSGAHLIRLLFQEPWPMRIVVYSGAMDEGMLREALAESPHGFVRKQDSLAELRMALRAVASGSRYISHCAEHLMMNKNGNPLRSLTPQECAVLQMIAEGRYTKEMAATLGVSEKTVDHHRQNVMNKLGLHDAVALTKYAIRHQMVTP